MLATETAGGGVLLRLTQAMSRSRTVEDIYTAALDALAAGLGVERSSILLFDDDRVMRFKAARGLSDAYRAAVEGHSPWTPETRHAAPIVVPDCANEPSLAAYLETVSAERIAAMTFIPLISLDRVVGKFMLYYATPHAPSEDELQLAQIIAAQVAFAAERTRTEAQARRSEERLRFALDAAAMGTWDWDLVANIVRWSDNLEPLHGLPHGTFDGSFASYEREIHPDDRERVLSSVRRALDDGVAHEVEYRLVGPDGTIRWCEGKGRVETQNGRPVRMTGVCMMVTRRKEAELARLQAAEEASRLKDEFLATLSHELRTPLNAIVGWVQMLQRGGLSPERAYQAVEVIGRNARLQAQLIEDILDVSRIITDKLQIELEPIAMRTLIDSAVAAIAPAAGARRILIAVEIPDTLPPIEGDAKRLSQVLNNVLANAVKFTPDEGRVTIVCETQDDWLAVRVRDTGIGIESEFLPFVFDRFRQADSRSTRRHGGLGLGLSIARHLVEQHGGNISVESEGVGTGTEVCIRLPLWLRQAGMVATGELSSVQPVPALTGVSAVLVDDQRDSRELLAALLELHGAFVVQCDSARGVVEQLRDRPSDVLIADIAMPEVDGYELIARVRAADLDVPAIAVTAYARPDDRRRALAAGYTAYCAKPVDAAQLVSTIRALVPVVA